MTYTGSCVGERSVHRVTRYMYSYPGLTATSFFRSLTDENIRRFVAGDVLSVLDALFGGRIADNDLRRVVSELVDFGELLGDRRGRGLVVQLVPEEKRLELDERIGRSVSAIGADHWTEEEIGRLREFFGVLEEDINVQNDSGNRCGVPGYGLFYHQRVAVGKLTPLLRNGERRAVLHLPTGVGKTRTAMHVVSEWLRLNEPSVVVWLASGKELLDQAVAAFREAWSFLGTRSVQIATMRGDETPDLNQLADGFLAVGLSKGWARLQTDVDWATALSRRVRLVVFDEAHQSIAQTYRRIADDLTVDYRCALLGLTATPGRTWADIDADGTLAEFYAGNKVTLDVPGDNPIEFLISNGFLARPTFRTLLAKPGLDVGDNEVERVAGRLDIPVRNVAALSMSERYVTAVLSAIEDLIGKGHRRVLVFAASVAHARLLTAVLLARGVRGETVTGATPARVRDRIVGLFRADDGDTMVLVNFGVLATGFDAPRASAAVIARPTKSLVLYSQMVGRVIRGPKAGGTGACEIVTVVDPRLSGFGDVAAAFLNWEDVW